MFYNTEWRYDHGMAGNYHGKKFFNIGPKGRSHKTILVQMYFLVS